VAERSAGRWDIHAARNMPFGPGRASAFGTHTALIRASQKDRAVQYAQSWIAEMRLQPVGLDEVLWVCERRVVPPSAHAVAPATSALWNIQVGQRAFEGFGGEPDGL
jgi:hypothetical protein